MSQIESARRRAAGERAQLESDGDDVATREQAREGRMRIDTRPTSTDITTTISFPDTSTITSTADAFITAAHLESILSAHGESMASARQNCLPKTCIAMP
eukprot:792869-Pleurochrysis_carterae.AAC.2